MGELIRVLPSDAVAWEDVAKVFGTRGEPARCLCQRMRWPHRAWHEMPVSEREERLRVQAGAGGGLVASLGAEPEGWCAVGPRPGFGRLMQAQTTVPWAGRSEDKADEGVWAVACFVTRAGFRRQGRDAGAGGGVGWVRARAGGAGGRGVSDGRAGGEGRALGGDERPGAERVFEAAGFKVVSRPGLRRVVMRVELGRAKGEK